jgi:hypothetical protein
MIIGKANREALINLNISYVHMAKKKICEVFLKHEVEILIFFVMFFRLIINMPLKTYEMVYNSHILMPFLVSFKLGIAQRFLVGSIIQLFTNKISLDIIWGISFTSTIIFFLLVSVLAGKVYRKTEEKYRFPLIMVVLLFLFSPLSSQFATSNSLFGRMEVFHQTFILLAAICLGSKKTVWLIPFFSIICISIHQVYVFFYFAPLLLILFYKAAVLQNKKDKAVYIAVLSITLITSSVCFLFFQFYQKLNVNSAQEMIDVIYTYADLKSPYYVEKPLQEDFFDMVYFTGITEQAAKFGFPEVDRRVIYILYGLLLLSPLVWFFRSFWKKCIKSETSKIMKFVYFAACMMPIAAIPAFILTLDSGRWFASLLFMQFFLVIFFVSQKEEAVLSALSSFYNTVISKWRAVYILVLLWLMMLGNFSEVSIFEFTLRLESTHISSKLRSLITLVWMIFESYIIDIKNLL